MSDQNTPRPTAAASTANGLFLIEHFRSPNRKRQTHAGKSPTCDNANSSPARAARQGRLVYGGMKFSRHGRACAVTRARTDRRRQEHAGGRGASAVPADVAVAGAGALAGALARAGWSAEKIADGTDLPRAFAELMRERPVEDGEAHPVPTTGCWQPCLRRCLHGPGRRLHSRGGTLT